MKYRTYLAGPIGDVPLAEARVWREKTRQALEKLGIGVLDPLCRESELPTRRKIFQFGKRGQLNELRHLVYDKLFLPDLRLVEKCDFVTFMLPKEDGQEVCGSYGEITHARKLGIPVYIITARRLKPLNVPYWAVGCSTNIFASWKEYFNYVKKHWANGDGDGGKPET
jgi:hypothetical protein